MNKIQKKKKTFFVENKNKIKKKKHLKKGNR